VPAAGATPAIDLTYGATAPSRGLGNSGPAHATYRSLDIPVPLNPLESIDLKAVPTLSTISSLAVGLLSPVPCPPCRCTGGNRGKRRGRAARENKRAMTPPRGVSA
jgi:hypothetical protein